MNEGFLSEYKTEFKDWFKDAKVIEEYKQTVKQRERNKKLNQTSRISNREMRLMSLKKEVEKLNERLCCLSKKVNSEYDSLFDAACSAFDTPGRVEELEELLDWKAEKRLKALYD